MLGRLTYVPATGGKTVEHSVSQRVTYVGRDKDCAIRVEDDSVDGKQFVISITGQKVRIQNLSRKSPTLVNEIAIGIREERELSDSDTISFGNRRFVWTMSASSGRRTPAKHDCLKRARISEPVRKVAVVTPHRREAPAEEEWASMPPEKRRRTMFDPTVTPGTSSFAKRVKYDKIIKERMTPNRRKQSATRETPTTSGVKKKAFTRPLESPQLSYDHQRAFNKSITPGKFYRGNTGPYIFGGFTAVAGEPMSPGLFSGCDSFLGMEPSPKGRRSSARVSTPYPNKSLNNTSLSHKTPRSRASGMHFPPIHEEMGRAHHDATPSSYFSSTSGTPRMMRAESPTILPGGSGTPQGRRSLAQSSRSSTYGTPQEPSLNSINDSMFVNAPNSLHMSFQDFDDSSVSHSRYSWTRKGQSSRSDSFSQTPPLMRTPRRTRGPIESPGSAQFSPNPSEASTSGYVLLSPRGRNIINRAFNRNDMSLQLGSHSSPSRRLFGFTPEAPPKAEQRPPLSVQVLTKSLRKKLDRSAANSPQNVTGTPKSKLHERDGTLQTGGTPGTTTPKSKSIASKRTPARQSSEPDLSRSFRKSDPQTPDLVGTNVAEKGVKVTTDPLSAKSGKNKDSDTPSGGATPRLSRRSSGATLSQSSKPINGTELKKSVNGTDPPSAKRNSAKNKASYSSLENATPQLSKRSSGATSQLSQRAETSDSNQSVKGTPQRDERNSVENKGSDSGNATQRLSRQSSGATPRQSNRNVVMSDQKKGAKATPSTVSSVENEARDSPVGSATQRLSRQSSGATPRQTSEPDLFRSRKSRESPSKTPDTTGISTRSSRKMSTKQVLSSVPVSKRKLAKSLSAESVAVKQVASIRKSLPSSLEGPHTTGRVPTRPKNANLPVGTTSTEKQQKATPKSTPKDGSTARNAPPNTVEDSMTSLNLTSNQSHSPKMPITAWKRKLAKSMSAESVVKQIPSSRNSLPAILGLSKRRASQKVTHSVVQAPVKMDTPVPKRRSRASLIGEAAHFFEADSPSSSRKTPSPTKVPLPVINIIPPTPERLSEGPPSASSGRPSLTVVPQGIHRSSRGKRSTYSRSLDKAVPVTPPRSAEPDIVMRSSIKSSAVRETVTPPTPTSALRRNARRSVKKSLVPSIAKKLSLVSPRKSAAVKKLTLDPEKPDKNKMAALIACHKKKSPTKENLPSTSCSDEKMSPRSIPDMLTPLKDLDAQPEERSPEDQLLDALDLSRKSSVVTEPKKPSRRLRSSTSQRLSAMSTAPKTAAPPASPTKSVKKLLFKTPLVEYEGSQPQPVVAGSPTRALKGILSPSPMSASEEPMDRVFTTSPVVDFTDASGRKKIFVASPNSKSKAGGIRELVPTEETDLNIWTLFEGASSNPGSSAKKRKVYKTPEPIPAKKARTPPEMESPSPPRSSRRKRAHADQGGVLIGKRTRKVVETSSQKSTGSGKTSSKKTTPVKAVESPPPTKSTPAKAKNQKDAPKKKAVANVKSALGTRGTKKSVGEKSASPPKLSKLPAKNNRKSSAGAKPRQALAGKPRTGSKNVASQAKPKKSIAKLATTKSKKSGESKTPAKRGRPAVSKPSKKQGSPSPVKSLGDKKVAPTRAEKEVKKPGRKANAAPTSPKAGPSKTAKQSAPNGSQVSPRKTRGKAAIKASPKPMTTNTAHGEPKTRAIRPRLSVPPKPVRVKAVTKSSKDKKDTPPGKSSKQPAERPKARGRKPVAPTSSPKAGSTKTTEQSASSSSRATPRKTRSKATAKASPKPASEKPTRANAVKLPIPPKPVRGKAVGAKAAPNKSPRESPVKTRSRRAPAPTARGRH